MYERHRHTVGLVRSATHSVWTNMIARCTNPNRPDFRYYGARGITVCDRWKNSFAHFLGDMGEKPKNMTLDRIDNNKGYGVENCRWATKDQQMQNTRSTRLISHQGKTQGISAWARELGLQRNTISARLKSCSTIEQVLSPKKRANDHDSY